MMIPLKKPSRRTYWMRLSNALFFLWRMLMQWFNIRCHAPVIAQHCLHIMDLFESMLNSSDQLRIWLASEIFDSDFMNRILFTFGKKITIKAYTMQWNCRSRNNDSHWIIFSQLANNKSRKVFYDVSKQKIFRSLFICYMSTGTFW